MITLKIKALVPFVLFAFLFTGCSSLIAVREETSRRFDPPSLQSYENFYFWGLKGHAQIDTTRICGERPTDQVETVYTLEDTLFIVFSLGIYTPQTYRVWCGQRQPEALEAPAQDSNQ